MLRYILTNKIATIFLVSGVLSLGIGTYQLLFAQSPKIENKESVSKSKNVDQSAKEKIKIDQKESSVPAQIAKITPAVQKIKVDVSGAVDYPGVYELEESARVSDAIYTAGGLGSKADSEWVSHNINMAIKLNDGDKIYIPQKGEIKQLPQEIVTQEIKNIGNEETKKDNPPPQVAGIATSKPGVQQTAPPKETEKPQTAQTPTDGKVSINTATSAELDVLPGIGPVTAQKIISNRPYATLEQLKEKKAVNNATFEKIKEKIKL
jgi:competence protein ComEA